MQVSAIGFAVSDLDLVLTKAFYGEIPQAIARQSLMDLDRPLHGVTEEFMSNYRIVLIHDTTYSLKD